MWEVSAEELSQVRSRLGIGSPNPSRGVTVRVVRQGCRKKCQWAWAVLLDGVVKASGNEETEAEAKAIAEQEAAELRAIYFQETKSSDVPNSRSGPAEMT